MPIIFENDLTGFAYSECLTSKLAGCLKTKSWLSTAPSEPSRDRRKNVRECSRHPLTRSRSFPNAVRGRGSRLAEMGNGCARRPLPWRIRLLDPLDQNNPGAVEAIRAVGARPPRPRG